MITDEQSKLLQDKQVFQWVALKAAVIKDGKILLGKRLDSNDYGLFETPGGKLEIGENLTECLKREVFEETGIEIEPVNDSEDCPQSILINQSDRKTVVMINILAKVLSTNKMLIESEELSEINFYTKEEVKKILVNKKARRIVIPILDKFIKGEI